MTGYEVKSVDVGDDGVIDVRLWEPLTPSWDPSLLTMPTRAQYRALLVKQLSGPHPGPNRVAIAEILADQYLRICDEGDFPPPFRDEEQ